MGMKPGACKAARRAQKLGRVMKVSCMAITSPGDLIARACSTAQARGEPRGSGLSLHARLPDFITSAAEHTHHPLEYCSQ